MSNREPGEDGIPIKLRNVYLRKTGRKENLDIWIVDGATIRRDVFDEFLQGGNDQRYRFTPPGEIWIDGSTSVEEYEYALMHELHERRLMISLGWSYNRAHMASLMLELQARRKNRLAARDHELRLPPMATMDNEGNQEIPDIGTKVQLNAVYRAPLGKRGRLHIWVVDGAVVRREVYPDFGFSGHGLRYCFIPSNEIWIDDMVDCAEMDYQLTHQLHERAAMAHGADYETAYGRGSQAQVALRRRDAAQAQRREEQLAPVEPGTRERGTKPRGAVQKKQNRSARK